MKRKHIILAVAVLLIAVLLYSKKAKAAEAEKYDTRPDIKGTNTGNEEDVFRQMAAIIPEKHRFWVVELAMKNYRDNTYPQMRLKGTPNKVLALQHTFSMVNPGTTADYPYLYANGQKHLISQSDWDRMWNIAAAYKFENEK